VKGNSLSTSLRYKEGWGMEMQRLLFLTSTVDGGECFNITSRPEKNPSSIEYEVEQKTQ
jgi:hypothetical protein